MNVFNSIKEINILSNGVSNIYLRVTIEMFSKLQFLSLKFFHQVSFWIALTQADTIEFLNFLLQLKNQRSGSKTVCGFSIILILKGIMTF